MEYKTRVNPDNKIAMLDDTCTSQQILSLAIDTHTNENIRNDRRNDNHFQAHLNLTATSRAGLWLHAVPSKAIGTHVDSLLYKTIVQRWLRLLLYDSEFHCPYSDVVVDRFGDHCLVCSYGGDRTKRHNLICNEIFHICNGTGLNPELERPGILQPRPLAGSVYENGAARDPQANRRPADVYLPRWRRGAPAALDLAVTSGLRSDMVQKSVEDGSVAVKTYENFKRSYLEMEFICKKEGINFILLLCEAMGGGWGPAANTV